MRRFVILLVVVAGLAGVWAWQQKQKARAREDAEQSKLKSYQLVRKTLERTVEAVGIIQPAFLLEIKSKASGTIVSMPFHEGDVVKEGDLLVELLPIDEERNVRMQRARVVSVEAQAAKARNQLRQAELDLQITKEQAESRLKAAQVAYDVAHLALVRQESLQKKELSSERDFDLARQAAENAESSLDLAKLEQRSLVLRELDVESRREDVSLQLATLEREEIALEVAELRLSETRIRSPMEGLVLTRKVEPGQIIASGISNVSGGTTLLTLADVSHLYLDTEVDESDIGGIRPGLEVDLTAEAYPGRHFSGRVQRVAPQGESVQNVTIFRVRIELDEDAVSSLLPGMNATSTIVVERRPDSLVIPVEAIRRRKGTKVGVMVTRPDASPEFVPVKLGLRVGSEVVVEGALEEGQEILLGKDDQDSGGRRGPGMRDGMRTLRRMGRR